MQIADLGGEARFNPRAIQAHTSYFTVKDVFAGNHGVGIKRLLKKCWATPTKPIASHITGMEGKQMINPVFAHNSGKNTRSFCVYTVYDNRTDLPVIVDGDARESATAMGLTLASFYSAVVRAKSGAIKRWHIEKRYLDGRPEYKGWATISE